MTASSHQESCGRCHQAPCACPAGIPTLPSAADLGQRAGEVVQALSPAQQRALGSLLDGVYHLGDIAHAIAGERFLMLGLRLSGFAERMGAAACDLAGIPLSSFEPPRAGDREPLGFELVSLEVEKHTDRLWGVHLYAPVEKSVVHYIDGPSRRMAVASALVLCARNVLEGATPLVPPWCFQCGQRATCLSLEGEPGVVPVYACSACCNHDTVRFCEPTEGEVPSLEARFDNELRRAMEALDDLIPMLAGSGTRAGFTEQVPPPTGFHRWAAGCDPAKKNPAGICNCPCPGEFGKGPELSCHGSGGVE